jgi:Ca2+-transporting ATPase
MKPYLSEASQVLSQLKSTAQGLSAQDAAQRLSKFGPNRLAEGKKTPLILRFLRELADPMVIILLAAALISGITAAYSGDSFADVIIILVVVLINAVLGVAQESKAEQAIAALQEMAAATSKVLRDGTLTTIPSHDLVPGDVILLEAGDAVPADGRILEAASLKIEESALTGESVPVNKHSGILTPDGQPDVPLGDRKNMVYMGSSVAYGRSTAVVTATGMDTEMGKIAGAITAAKDQDTPLQQKLGQLSRILSILVLGICAVIFAVDLLRSYPNITGQGVLSTFMVAVSLAVAAIPEGLAAVVTIVLSMGVTKMSGKNAIIRKLTAVETLGCTQVICSDKTGTLTQNRMTVVDHAGSDIPRLALGMALCSDARLDPEGQAVGEPTECALVTDALAQGVSGDTAKYPRIGEAPFDSSRKLMSTIHRDESGNIIQFTKGAPDVVLDRCTHYWDAGESLPMTAEKRAEILSANKTMADQALRVLCCAQRLWAAVPEHDAPETLEQNLCYLGLSGMIDPIRPEVKAAISECRQAGIRPVMITGDHRDTAVAIAKQLGILEGDQQAITGTELDRLDDEALARNIAHYSVYARVQPEHKVRIVSAWQKNGCITAMTGDGVNDAPSIKTADIGVGMGITGTDVTKNVADMVLADDNFATIVSAVEEGRRIYDNIRKAIGFLLASNLAEVLAIFAATLMGFTILQPVHLLWINLITDCFPALALGLEQAEPNIMARKPRDPKAGIFSDGLGLDVVVQGLIVTALTLAAYFIGHRMEAGVWAITDSPDGTTMAFLTLSMVELFHAFNLRSRRQSIFTLGHQNLWLWGAMLLSLALTSLVIYVPPLSAAFGFETISLTEYLTALALAMSIIPIMELAKVLLRRLGK